MRQEGNRLTRTEGWEVWSCCQKAEDAVLDGHRIGKPGRGRNDVSFQGS